MSVQCNKGADGTLTHPYPPSWKERDGNTPTLRGIPAVILSPTPDEPYRFSCAELLAAYRATQSRHPLQAEPLRYRLPRNKERVVSTIGPFVDYNPHTNPQDSETSDQFTSQMATVYNPSSDVDGIMAIRWEPLNIERSIVEICSFEEGAWTPGAGPTFSDAQDPYHAKLSIRGSTFKILSINSITEMEPDGIGVHSWEQRFYSYTSSVREIDEPFAIGPRKEKCGRIGIWPDGKIAVFGRRQGGAFGMGKLTYNEISYLDELQDALHNAPVIEGVFLDNEWGGVNDILSLDSNRYLGLIGHLAYFHPLKCYFGMYAIYDRTAGQVIEMEIFLDTRDLPFKVVVKKADLDESLAYIGGSVGNLNNHLKVNGGCGDTGAYVAVCQCDLFRRYYGRS